VERTGPDPEPECPVYGVARFSLHRLAQGDLCTKMKANIVPITKLKGGAELDWKTRPGKYIESGASLTLKVQAAAPITRGSKETAPAKPYSRVVFVSDYKDPELYVKLRKVLRKQNTLALGLKGTATHIVTSLATYKLEPEQQQDPDLDLLTGFQLVDSARRVIVIEGLQEGAMRHVIAIAREAVANPPEGVERTILYNERLTYGERLYGWLGADLWPLKLAKKLNELPSVANNMTGNRLRPECMEAIKRLDKLIQMKWYREVDRMGLLPTYPQLNALDKRFAGELTIEDMEGAKLKKRIRTAVFKEDKGKEAEVDMTVTETSAPSITSTEARRRLAMKAGLDMDNSAYLAIVRRQREERLTRDWHAESVTELEDLYKTKGRTKKEEFLRQNPHRHWEDMPPEMAEMERTRRKMEAMRTADPPPIHPRNFQYPVATQPHEFLHFSNKPTGARCEELTYRWVENENFPPTVFSDAKNAHLFKLIFPNARRGGRPFDEDMAALRGNGRSIFAGGDDNAAALYEAAQKEEEQWRSKVVVDDLNFHSVLHGEKRVKPGQLDRIKALMQDPAKKLSYRLGAKHSKPACLSIMLEEPWQEFGPKVDFNPGKSDRHPDLQATDPKDKPVAYLRPLRKECFSGTFTRNGSTIEEPLDFTIALPHKEPETMHKRQHADRLKGHKLEVAKNPTRQIPPMEPLDRTYSSTLRRPGTPPLPFGNVVRAEPGQ